MRILHAQIKSSEEAEKVFDSALKQKVIAKDIKPTWLEWLVLTKGNCKSNQYHAFLNFYFASVIKVKNMYSLSVSCNIDISMLYTKLIYIFIYF